MSAASKFFVFVLLITHANKSTTQAQKDCQEGEFGVNFMYSVYNSVVAAYMDRSLQEMLHHDIVWHMQCSSKAS